MSLDVIDFSAAATAHKHVERPVATGSNLAE